MAKTTENQKLIDLTVVIITLNEEANIQRCLQSLPRGSEVFVLDSGSIDRTKGLARDFGAKVVEREFTSYDDQKNHGISLGSRTWILSLDADESLDPECRDAVVGAVRENKDRAFSLKRRLVFMDRKMRFGKTSDSPVRLFKRDKGKFESAIHEKLVVEHPVDQLPGTLWHFSYKNLEDYFKRFNRYTTAIAANHYKNNVASPQIFLHALRPWIEFFHRYILRGGFLDGYPGYTYALISSVYTYVKYAKLIERRRGEK